MKKQNRNPLERFQEDLVNRNYVTTFGKRRKIKKKFIYDDKKRENNRRKKEKRIKVKKKMGKKVKIEKKSLKLCRYYSKAGCSSL